MKCPTKLDPFQILRLNQCLGVVDRIGEQPRTAPRNSPCQKRDEDWSSSNAFPIWRAQPHHVFIACEINCHRQNFSQQSWVEPQVQSSDAIFSIDLDACIDRAFVFVIWSFLELKQDSGVIYWRLYSNVFTTAIELGMPVSSPAKKIIPIGI